MWDSVIFVGLILQDFSVDKPDLYFHQDGGKTVSWVEFTLVKNMLDNTNEAT